jgi:TM2 domain-containing membrane protein YozV
MTLIQCSECGSGVSDRAAACPRCGNPVRGLPYPAAMVPTKSRGTAVLLAMLLGGIGVHKFYLDQPGWGILYMLFCWTFIPAVIGFLEGITYLAMTNADFEQKYSGA